MVLEIVFATLLCISEQVYFTSKEHIRRTTCSCSFGTTARCYHVVAALLYSKNFKTLRISYLIEFLGQSPDNNQTLDLPYAFHALERGEDSVISSHVVDFSVLEGTFFRGTVLPSMKNAKHKRFVEVRCVALFYG